MKKKLAIFDLADCEGCETEFFAMRNTQDFLMLNKFYDIVNWRLVSNQQKNDSFDIALIEGIPASKYEISKLKSIRKKSRILIALGACAGLGGIPAIIDENKRSKLIDYVYGKNFTARAIEAKPISAYVKIDYYISGCPANPQEIKEILLNLAHNKILKEKTYPVCLECKAKNNTCLFIEKAQPCLGPITKGGCNAICPTQGLRCYGCWGQLAGGNFSGMITALKKQGKTKTEIKKIMDIFWNKSKEYQKYLK